MGVSHRATTADKSEKLLINICFLMISLYTYRCLGAISTHIFFLLLFKSLLQLNTFMEAVIHFFMKFSDE